MQTSQTDMTMTNGSSIHIHIHIVTNIHVTLAPDIDMAQACIFI